MNDLLTYVVFTIATEFCPIQVAPSPLADFALYFPEVSVEQCGAPYALHCKSMDSQISNGLQELFLVDCVREVLFSDGAELSPDVAP